MSLEGHTDCPSLPRRRCSGYGLVVDWHWAPVPYLDTGGDGLTGLVALLVVNGLIWAFALLAAGNVIVWTVRLLLTGPRATIRHARGDERRSAEP